MYRRNDNKLFDKSDIYFCKDLSDCEMFSEVIKDHTLMYVYSGQLTIRGEDSQYDVGANECVFLKKGSRINSNTFPKDGKPFHATYIRLRKSFLKKFFRRMKHRDYYEDKVFIINNTTKVVNTPDIQSLFCSILPYYRENVLPNPVATDLKLQAGIFSLLNMQIGFYSILFDFRIRWCFPWFEFILN